MALVLIGGGTFLLYKGCKTSESVKPPVVSHLSPLPRLFVQHIFHAKITENPALLIICQDIPRRSVDSPQM